VSDLSIDALNEPARIAALRTTGLLDSAPEEAFDRLTRLVCRVLDAPVALVSLVDRDRQFFKSQHGLPEPVATERQTALSHSFCQHVVRRGAPLIVTDARADVRVRDNLAVRDLSVVAYLGTPLVTPEGHVLGSLCVLDSRPRDWSEADRQTLGDFAAVVMSEIALREEITRRERSEDQLELVNRELAHRIKNIFTVVQSLLAMAARRDVGARSFVEAVSGRLSALAKAYTLFAQGPSDGQRSLQFHSFGALVARLLEAYPGDQWTITGDDLPIGPASATALALIFHELATNAVKYGALSVAEGHVSVEARRVGEEALLVWRERGGPSVAGPPAAKGFGALLAERSVSGQLAGTLQQDWATDGLRVELRVPLGRLRS
jgi:two-component sensor histidine kinase